jgi:hypothetical protein
LSRFSNYPQLDTALLSGSGYSSYVFVGGSVGSARPVRGAGDVGFEGNYCVSGARTYESCGKEVEKINDSLCDSVGCSEAIRYSPASTADGDSGAPFYAYYSSGAVAIRGSHIGQLNGKGYATKWSNIAAGHNATIFLTP